LGSSKKNSGLMQAANAGSRHHPLFPLFLPFLASHHAVMCVRSISRGLTCLPGLAVLLAIALAPRAHAAGAAPDSKDPWSFIKSETPPTTADEAARGEARDVAAEANEAATALPDAAAVDWSVLDSSPPALRETPKHSTARNESAGAAWSRSDRPGGTALTVKQPLLPLWDTRIGADMTVAGGEPSLPLPEKLASDGRLWESSGVAWAAMTAPGLGSLWDKTAIEARVDPTQDQSRLGTSISKTLPLEGNATSLTLQGGYNRIEQTLLPGFAGRTVVGVEADRSARFNFNSTGTSLIAGQTLGATEKWLRRVGAEQKLFGDITVSGAVSETSTGGLNKSLTAGFKKTW
jgi:hypothetical protein